MDSTEWLTGCAFEWTVHFMQRDKLVWIILLHRVADWVFAGSGGLTERALTVSSTRPPEELPSRLTKWWSSSVEYWEDRAELWMSWEGKCAIWNRWNNVPDIRRYGLAESHNVIQRRFIVQRGNCKDIQKFKYEKQIRFNFHISVMMNRSSFVNLTGTEFYYDVGRRWPFVFSRNFLSPRVLCERFELVCTYLLSAFCQSNGAMAVCPESWNGVEWRVVGWFA